MQQAIVHVVPTLRQYHAAAPGYGFDALTRVLESLRPDAIVVELTGPAARERRPQPVKHEYQHSVFPYAQRHAVPLVPMEPEGPLFDELVTRSLEAQQQCRERLPQRYAHYERDATQAFQELLRSCDSPAAFDAEPIERAMQAKHAREHELFGPAYDDGWERWNEHLAQAIAQAALARPGQRILALAGLEHVWWLRPRLDALARASGAWTLAPRLGTGERRDHHP